MRYMLLIYGAEDALDAETRDACYIESAGLAQSLAAEGVYVDASPLRLVNTATSVRVQDGKRIVTDGPFAETREQLGGYYIVDTENLDQAIAIAERIPGAKWGTVEIRPILEIGGLPE
ncbi:MAG: YciI family protein [Thermomicrobiales bacterium]|nr:YciI family protein [Thermomicrobiales bacterium]